MRQIDNSPNAPRFCTQWSYPRTSGVKSGFYATGHVLHSPAGADPMGTTMLEASSHGGTRPIIEKRDVVEATFLGVRF